MSIVAATWIGTTSTSATSTVRTIESICIVRAATSVHHSGWGVRGCVMSIQWWVVWWVVWRFGHWKAVVVVLNVDIGRWIQAVYNEFTQLTTINLLSFFIDDCIKWTKIENFFLKSFLYLRRIEIKFLPSSSRATFELNFHLFLLFILPKGN